ncbi:uncharacterized protein LOC127700825 isoform X2 [Mytilus californianus]|uniref:uncharacterized protein LOC127700825 isoform X2 n=1 Tax=Mytilus californianus TaxID=6549 RepID=UPI002245323B|nr:uncharacterized protein LOC127700825 isoform X2 [Mytilus californianus]
MPRSRKNPTHLKPWLIDAILMNTEPIKANSVKVLKHLVTREDGSVIREVTDGSVFIKADFSHEAIEEMFSEEGSTQPEWYSALLILRKYTIHFDVTNCLERSEFVLKISSASIWDLQQGFYLKYRVLDCMDNNSVRELAREAYENCHKSQHRDDSMDCSIPLTQLLDNMTNVDSQDEEPITADELTCDMISEEIFISIEQQAMLDNIEEWKTDYIPSFEDNSQIYPQKSQDNSSKDKEVLQQDGKMKNPITEKTCKKKSCIEDKAIYEQIISNSGDIVSSGESIRLSCSDHSSEDIHNHGDELSTEHHSNNSKVSSSSGSHEHEDIKAKYLDNVSSKKEKKKENSSSTNYQKHFENFILSDHDHIVTSTVLIAETQPFTPTVSPLGTQSFSPKEYDPLISISPLLNKSDPLISFSPETNEPCDQISHDREEITLSTSVHEVTHGTPKKDQNKPAILNASEYTDNRLEEERIKSTKIIKRKDKPIETVVNVQIKKKGKDNFEKERLTSICKQTQIGQLENDEENRLNKLSSPSDKESAEHLIQELSKNSSFEENSSQVELSKFEDSHQVVALSQKSEDSQCLKQSQDSISDKTLMEISSGQMKTVVVISNSGNFDDNLDGLGASMEQSVMVTDETENKKSQKYVFKRVLPDSFMGKERGKQTSYSNQHRNNQSNENNQNSDKHLCLSKKENMTSSDKSFTGVHKGNVLTSGIKSSKRNRCELTAEVEPSGKSRKVDTHAGETTENNSIIDTDASHLSQESETSPRLLQSTRSTRKLPSEISFEKIGGKKIRLKRNPTGKSSSPKENSNKGEKKDEEEQSQSILMIDKSRSPSKQFGGETVHDVIVISSGESGSKGKQLRAKNAGNLEKREIKEISQTSVISSCPIDLVPCSPEVVSTCSQIQNKPMEACDESEDLSEMDRFLAEIQPETEIGRKLLQMTVPSDLAVAAFNYYRNKDFVT